MDFYTNIKSKSIHCDAADFENFVININNKEKKLTEYNPPAFSTEIKEEKSEYELMRERNMKELESWMSGFSDEINGITESISSLNKYSNLDPVIPSSRKRKRNSDTSFLFKGAIPLERRRSDRLSKIAPEYSYLDMPDENALELNRRYYHDSDNIENLEKVIYRKSQSFYNKPNTTTPFVSVENITEEYLNNIASKVIYKKYSSSDGTSCHQCRQKTTDSKTYCRSGNCIGVRGQFCGVCLKNRYGEDAREALLDSNWQCPPCRGLCNCSICRTRQGKRPTGILAPFAFQYGHKSVKDLLLSLKGEGEYVNGPRAIKEEKTQKETHKMTNNSIKNDDENELLIGFNEDLQPVCIINKEPVMMKL